MLGVFQKIPQRKKVLNITDCKRGYETSTHKKQNKTEKPQTFQKLNSFKPEIKQVIENLKTYKMGFINYKTNKKRS